MSEELSKKIRMLREQHDLTLEELGKRVGVGKSTVRKWETGQIANMRRDKIPALAKALGVSVEYLIGVEDESSQGYYTDPRTAKVAQAILDSKELSALFDVSRKISPEDITTVYQMALALYRKEHGND